MRPPHFSYHFEGDIFLIGCLFGCCKPFNGFQSSSQASAASFCFIFINLFLFLWGNKNRHLVHHSADITSIYISYLAILSTILMGIKINNFSLVNLTTVGICVYSGWRLSSLLVKGRSFGVGAKEFPQLDFLWECYINFENLSFTFWKMSVTNVRWLRGVNKMILLKNTYQMLNKYQ